MCIFAFLFPLDYTTNPPIIGTEEWINRRKKKETQKSNYHQWNPSSPSSPSSRPSAFCGGTRQTEREDPDIGSENHM
jgi:hypothetical protein